MNAQKVYFFRFTVEGRGAFPIDMLRYDHCWPSDQEAASLIGTATNYGETRKVRLEGWSYEKPSLTMGPKAGMTTDRWQSFGWRVVDTTAML